MSALANVYVYLIRQNKRTLDDVPAFLKKEVEKLLKSE
ncbi:CD1375 family protein [Peptostreptococcus sp. D1]|nr:CD1375 family protein [Peptostreptococcus sp. D1]